MPKPQDVTAKQLKIANELSQQIFRIFSGVKDNGPIDKDNLRDAWKHAHHLMKAMADYNLGPDQMILTACAIIGVICQRAEPSQLRKEQERN